MAENRKLRRVTDLFVQGTAVDLTGDGSELVFVRKPNAFERGEADADARAARQLRMATLERDDNESSHGVTLAAERLSDDELLNGIITPDRNRAYLEAINDIRAQEEWFERLEMLERTDQRMSDGATLTEDEQEEFNRFNTEYLAAVNVLHQEKIADLRAEHKDDTREDLIKGYVKVWIDMEGMGSFEEEQWVGLLYYALRDCTAKVPKGGRVEDVDHRRCTHPRLLESKSEVRELPDELRALIEPVLREQLVNKGEAGNSDAPTSSSASSEQPSVEEESAPSTQKAG